MNKLKQLILLCICSHCSLFAEIPAETIYDQISDILHPTLEDYRIIQSYLSSNEREGVDARLGDNEIRMRNFRIIGDAPNEIPQFELIPVNCGSEERGNCIVSYGSFNWHYPDGVRRLVKVVSESDFKGHIMIRIGGWPNVEGGSLTLAHIPQAHKVCMMKEAERYGFKRVLWLDSSIVPVTSLNRVFEQIQRDGFLAIDGCHTLNLYVNQPCLDYFGITYAQACGVESCMSGMTGVDLTQERGTLILEYWHRAAVNKVAYWTNRLDQTALSLVLNYMNLTSQLSQNRVQGNYGAVTPDTFFVVDRAFVQY